MDFGHEQLANRLRKRAKHLNKWARRRGINNFRYYDRDLPDQPMVLDRYGDSLVCWTFERTRDETEDAKNAWERGVIAAIRAAFGDDIELFHKQRRRQRGRQTEGPGQYQRQHTRRVIREVQENNLTFELNMSDYLDVGLFLDHRPTRHIVQQHSADKRVLNLFAYTGSFSCYARAGGAHSTDTVDLSQTYLQWCERNFQLNQMPINEHHRLIKSDTLTFLNDAARSRQQYDIIICDPPTFSNSKSTENDWRVQRDHPALLTAIERVLAPTGICWFSNNARKFQLECPRSLIAKDITEQTLDEDMRDRTAHRCWQLTHAGNDTAPSK